MQWKYFIPSIYLVFILLHIILKLPRPRRIFLEFALFYIFSVSNCRMEMDYEIKYK